jgi:hypothetical protein
MQNWILAFSVIQFTMLLTSERIAVSMQNLPTWVHQVQDTLSLLRRATMYTSISLKGFQALETYSFVTAGDYTYPVLQKYIREIREAEFTMVVLVKLFQNGPSVSHCGLKDLYQRVSLNCRS